MRLGCKLIPLDIPLPTASRPQSPRYTILILGQKFGAKPDNGATEAAVINPCRNPIATWQQQKRLWQWECMGLCWCVCAVASTVFQYCIHHSQSCAGPKLQNVIWPWPIAKPRHVRSRLQRSVYGWSFATRAERGDGFTLELCCAIIQSMFHLPPPPWLIRRTCRCNGPRPHPEEEPREESEDRPRDHQARSGSQGGSKRPQGWGAPKAHGSCSPLGPCWSRFPLARNFVADSSGALWMRWVAWTGLLQKEPDQHPARCIALSPLSRSLWFEEPQHRGQGEGPEWGARLGWRQLRPRQLGHEALGAGPVRCRRHALWSFDGRAAGDGAKGTGRVASQAAWAAAHLGPARGRSTTTRSTAKELDSCAQWRQCCDSEPLLPFQSSSPLGPPPHPCPFATEGRPGEDIHPEFLWWHLLPPQGIRWSQGPGPQSKQFTDRSSRLYPPSLQLGRRQRFESQSDRYPGWSAGQYPGAVDAWHSRSKRCLLAVAPWTKQCCCLEGFGQLLLTSACSLTTAKAPWWRPIIWQAPLHGEGKRGQKLRAPGPHGDSTERAGYMTAAGPCADSGQKEKRAFSSTFKSRHGSGQSLHLFLS